MTAWCDTLSHCACCAQHTDMRDTVCKKVIRWNSDNKHDKRRFLPSLSCWVARPENQRNNHMSTTRASGYADHLNSDRQIQMIICSLQQFEGSQGCLYNNILWESIFLWPESKSGGSYIIGQLCLQKEGRLMTALESQVDFLEYICIDWQCIAFVCIHKSVCVLYMYFVCFIVCFSTLYTLCIDNYC